MTQKTEFSKNLRKLRETKGISQKSVANSLGISQALLSHYEKGIRECGLNFLLKASEFYEVTTDYLLCNTLEENFNGNKENSKKAINNCTYSILYKNLIKNSIDFIYNKLNSKDNCEYAQKSGVYFSIIIYIYLKNLFKGELILDDKNYFDEEIETEILIKKVVENLIDIKNMENVVTSDDTDTDINKLSVVNLINNLIKNQ